MSVVTAVIGRLGGRNVVIIAIIVIAVVIIVVTAAGLVRGRGTLYGNGTGSLHAVRRFARDIRDAFLDAGDIPFAVDDGDRFIRGRPCQIRAGRVGRRNRRVQLDRFTTVNGRRLVIQSDLGDLFVGHRYVARAGRAFLGGRLDHRGADGFSFYGPVIDRGDVVVGARPCERRYRAAGSVGHREISGRARRQREGRFAHRDNRVLIRAGAGGKNRRDHHRQEQYRKQCTLIHYHPSFSVSIQRYYHNTYDFVMQHQK